MHDLKISDLEGNQEFLNDNYCCRWQIKLCIVHIWYAWASGLFMRKPRISMGSPVNSETITVLDHDLSAEATT